MKRQSLTVKEAAVISDNVVLKGKVISNTSKANNGRKKERPTKSRREKK